MSGRKSQRKGYRNEAAFVKRMEAHDLAAQRMPLSGALGGVAGMDLGGDVKIWTVWNEWRVECKCRKDGFRELYKWLEPQNIDRLSLKANNRPGLIVMTEDTFAELVSEAEGFGG